MGKSTLARLLAVNYAKAGWTAKIADLDLNQGTVTSWNARRMQNGIQPEVLVEQYSNVTAAVRYNSNIDVLIFDGAPHANRQTLQIAQASDLVVIPTGSALDDLLPTVNLANELISKKVPPERIIIVLSRTGNSEAEIGEAREYLKKAGLKVAQGELPERTTIRRAQDAGLCANETPYASVNENSDSIIETIVKMIHK